MITNNILEYIFSAPSNITVMRALNERNPGISGRETARLTGLSLRTVQVCLSNLEKAGIIKKLTGKREHLFLINRQNFLTKNLIKQIFETERNYNEEVYKLIKSAIKKDSISIILFGSTARGDENISSDYDLCIVYKNNLKIIEEKVSTLRSSLFNLFNITLAPFYIPASRFKKLGLQGKSPINNIIKEGKVITGKSIKELLYG